ncbi:hypothetical protein [Acidovorax sp. A1169]|uniref:hypothetical protein n=1 Tax=Acidovorax sp. A1169 TaxID=3059524 RepID=UPI002737FF22|nr:hypothetical protein [Acidovorax sp. A1169]
MAQMQWSRGQLACALSEISRTARAMERIGGMQQSAPLNGDLEDEDALAFASRCLAQRIGWLADMASQCTAPGGEYVDLHSPLEWTMPPVFAARGRA